MGSITVNFSDVDSFEPLPEGAYDVEIDKVEVRRNKADDGDYLNWELVVLDGDFENRRLWMITSLKSNALFRLKDVFEALEVLDDDEEMDIEWDNDVEVSNSGGPRLLYPVVEGIECVAIVKNEMYDGRERNRVNELLGERPKKKSSKKSRRKVDSDNQQVAKARSRSRRRDEEDDDDEEDERPRRSRRRPSDDDEPKSSRRRSRDDDDDDDDEEEEAPRRSRRTSNSSKGKSRRRRMR